MFFKLSLIFVFSLSSIAVDASEAVMEKPIFESVTRGGRKFFGLFSVQTSPFKLFVNKNKRWRGDLFLAFGPQKLIATSVEFNHAYLRDPLCLFCLQQPQQFNTLVNHQQPHSENDNSGLGQIEQPIQYDSLTNTSGTQLTSKPSTVSVSATASLSTNTETSKETLTIKPSSQDALRTLKLEDYDVITFDGENNDNVSDESAVNRVRRESEDFKKESNDEMESTTIESSTLHTTMPSQDENEADSNNNHVVTISPMLELPQNPAQDFSTQSMSTSTLAYDEQNKHQLYPLSKNPHVQYISITNRPMSSYDTPVKNYYDFYPSQPDLLYHQNYFNFVPHCSLNYFRNKFAPIGYDNSAWISSNYHNQHQNRYYQWK